MPRLHYIHEDETWAAFARKATDHFATHPDNTSFGDLDPEGPEGFLALRWGVQPSKPNAVLVVKIAESRIYGDMDEDRAQRLARACAKEV